MYPGPGYIYIYVILYSYPGQCYGAAENKVPSCHRDLRRRMTEWQGKQRRHAEVTELSDTGTVLRWSSSHASLCLPWAISARSHIHTVCPIAPPSYNFSSLPSHPPSSSSSPLFFPLWSAGGLCERPGRRAEKKMRGVWKRREMLRGSSLSHHILW